MKKLLSATFLLAMCLCYSQEFSYATESANGTEYYYKTVSENLLGKTIWLKSIKPQKKVKLKSGKYITVGGEINLSYMTINCSSMKYSTEKLYIYDRNGNLKHEYDEHTFSEPIIPGSVLDGVRAAVCTDN